MRVKKPKEILKKQEYLTLAELSRLLADSDAEQDVDAKRNYLSNLQRYQILPYHRVEGLRSRYYRMDEIRQVLRACKQLIERRFYVREFKRELMKRKWYKDMVENAANDKD